MDEKKVDNDVTFEFPVDIAASLGIPVIDDRAQRFHADIPPEKYLTPAVAALLNEADEFRYDPYLDEIKALAGTGVIDGKLQVLVSSAYCLSPPDVQAEILLHECGHFVMGHWERCGERDPARFNTVCDAALHHSGVCDWELVEDHVSKVPGFEHFRSAIFERLIGKNGKPIPPMLAEAAYELLPVADKNDGEGKSDSCGGMGAVRSDDTAASRARWHQTAVRMLSEDKGFAQSLGHNRDAGGGEGSRPVPELKAPSPWIKQVITYLVRTTKRTHRTRSYRRENRAFDMLPGQSIAYGKGALFLLDASGSITEEMLTEFLSCVLKTPELMGSYVVVFDTTWTDPIPVTEMMQIVKAVSDKGGGTAIAAAGRACRLPHLPAVWVTDAYTGDGWPPAHTNNEVWCVYGDGPTPPTGVTIRIPKAS